MTLSPTDLRDLLKQRGWQVLPEAVADGLYVMSNADFAQRQIVFPTEDNAPDYAEAIDLSLQRLEAIYQQPKAHFLAAAHELHEDTIRFRVVAPRLEEAIPFSYAVHVINSAKSLLLAASHNAVLPQSHHPRLSRTEGRQFLEQTHFRHTEQGSFVLNVATPVRALDFQGVMYGSDVPFVRQTTLMINQALAALIQGIQADRLEQLVEEQQVAEKPVLSSNLCHALTDLQDGTEDTELTLQFGWAQSVALPADLRVPRTMRIQRDYFSRIAEVGRLLGRTAPVREERYICTVEELQGDLDAHHQRVGSVTLNLLIEGEVIRARANLNAAQYAIAYAAHIKANAYIQLWAKLHPGNQPRMLTDIAAFEAVDGAE